MFHQSVGYLSLFLKGSIKYEVLINQFAANGFTNMSDELQREFKDTYLRPLQQHEDWDDADKYLIRSWKFSGIRQLAGAGSAVIGWEDLSEWRLADFAQAARHVCIARPSSSTDHHQQQKDIRLPHNLIEDAINRRSLLFSGKWFPVRMSVQTLDMLVSNLRYLRVLDLHDLALKELPSSISKLIHLRYLDLSRNDFKELPGSICRLKNLQTLMLVYCDKLTRLPGSIKNIRHLKHLEIKMCMDLTHMPSILAKLTCLRRLDRFVVCPHKGGLRYLEHLDNLGGHLTIELPRRWENSVGDAAKANLERKIQLTGLEFKFCGTDNGHEDNHNHDVLEKLKPSASVEHISIVSFGGMTFPSWITPLGLGDFLARITISCCKRCETLPTFHRFRNLKYLTLTSMMNIEYLQDNISDADVSLTGFFHSLRELRVGCMPRLKGWSRDPSGLPRIVDMTVVEIWKCPRLTVMPTFSGSRDIPHIFFPSAVILQDVSEKLVQTLDCGGSYNAQIISIQGMVSLPINFITTNIPHDLEVKDCDQWQTFWPDNEGAQMAKSLSSESFIGFYMLSIENCRAMKHLSSGLRRLIHLRWLKIYRCSEELDCLYGEDEDGMPWKALQQLGHLEIGGFGNFEAIPKAFRYLKVLDLKISECRSLREGVDSLPRVSNLEINSCPHFVEELKREGHISTTDKKGWQCFDLR